MMSDKCPKCESVQWHPCWFDGMFQCSDCKYSEPLSGTFARLRNQLAQKEAEIERLEGVVDKLRQSYEDYNHEAEQCKDDSAIEQSLLTRFMEDAHTILAARQAAEAAKGKQ